MLQAIGGNEARSDMTTKRLAELDERDHQLEQCMAVLRDELAAVQPAQCWLPNRPSRYRG